MVVEKVLHDKYKVTDEEVTKQLKIKRQDGR